MNEEPIVSLTPPHWMSEDKQARAKYEELSPLLNESHFVQKIHEDALVTYCEEFTKARACAVEVAKEGVSIQSANGGCYINPMETARKMYLNETARQMKIMGLEMDQLKKAGEVKKAVAVSGPSSFLK